MSEATHEIALLPPKETALQVFTAEAGLDPYLTKIKQEIDAFTPDVTTKKGRDAIASMAYKVARSKSALDDVGKQLVAEYKEVPKKIDAERKRMRDLLDQWKDDVRKPLTEWEEAEQARIDSLKSRICAIKDHTSNALAESSETLRLRIEAVEAVAIDESWQEFEKDAMAAKLFVLESLRSMMKQRQDYEAEQAELARLRAEAAAREQKEREERIAREAAENARRQAEQQAQAERDAAARREAEERAAAERREMELKLAAERAEREKVEAEQREANAKAEAEARAKHAAEQERQRIADEQAEEARQTKMREANRAHKGRVNSAAKQALVDAGLSEADAEKAIKAIIQGKVPAVAISY